MKSLPINIDYSIAEFVAFQDRHNMYSINNYIIQKFMIKFNINTTNMIKNDYILNETINECI